MSEQQLDGTKIAGLAVDLRRFGPPHGVGAKGGAIEAGTLYPNHRRCARIAASRDVGCHDDGMAGALTMAAGISLLFDRVFAVLIVLAPLTPLALEGIAVLSVLSVILRNYLTHQR